MQDETTPSAGDEGMEAAKVGPALTPAQERALMERHVAAVAMAGAAAERPLALLNLCEVALTIASMAQAVGVAAQQGQPHPLGIYVERPAKVITSANGGVERVLVGMRLDGNQAVELMNAVANLRADRADHKPDEGAAAHGSSEPSETVGPAAPAERPRLHVVDGGGNG